MGIGALDRDSTFEDWYSAHSGRLASLVLNYLNLTWWLQAAMQPVNRFSWWVKLTWGGDINMAPLDVRPLWCRSLARVEEFLRWTATATCSWPQQATVWEHWRKMGSARLKHPRHTLWWAYQETICGNSLWHTTSTDRSERWTDVGAPMTPWKN